MLKHDLRTALRHLWRYKGYTFINVFGLAIGLACSVLLAQHVATELRYDTFHTNADRIYRVTQHVQNENTDDHNASVQYLVGPFLKEDYPEIQAMTRLWRDFSPLTSAELPNVRHGNEVIQEPRFFYADSAFFDVFSFELLAGDPNRVLRRPNEVLLTEQTAKRYFGDADPIGQTITIADTNADLEVIGLVADPPPHSHIQFDFLASITTLENGWMNAFQEPVPKGSLWTWNNTWTYVLLPKSHDPSSLEAKLGSFVERRLPERFHTSQSFRLQPLSAIHLTSDLDAEMKPGGNRTMVYVFSGIALFILLIALINFMNLATARALRRAREVGIRKVLGAHRRQLTRQFLGEALLMSGAAGIISLLLLFLFIPTFNTLINAHLTWYNFFEPTTLLLFCSSVVGIGILAGLYPALLLSAFKPVEVLHNQLVRSGRTAWIRQSLVVAQFSISILLFIATGVVYTQVDYLVNKELGFEADQIVVVNVNALGRSGTYQTYVNQLLQHERIVAATSTESIPGRFVYNYYLRPEGFALDQVQAIPYLWTDAYFPKVFGLTFLEGQEASQNVRGIAYVLNEAAVQALGWADDALGKQIFREQNGKTQWQGTVTGIVKDFHFRPLHSPIEPLILGVAPTSPDRRFSWGYSLLRVQPGNLQETIAYIHEQWQAVAPDWPFDYFFLDDNLAQLYEAEQNIQRLLTTFAGLALLIACLGLFGLAAFMAEQRTKEIGIRKVLGASTLALILLLTRTFSGLVVLAFIIASPLAYVIMNRWLDTFAYRMDMPISLFILAGLAALLLAWLTVSVQALKAARTNPVDTLQT